MGKKKFIDKKNSATFQLLARDSSCDHAAPSPASAPADRVFVRVDNNPHYAAPGTFADEEGPDDHGGHDPDLGEGEADPYSIFADAPEDTDDDDDDDGDCPSFAWGGDPRALPGGSALSDHVRREILELGLPDDGYNYLVHLREIRNTGGGSNYYHNSKARLDKVPLDVRAYDASRLRISSEVSDDGGGDPMYDVAVKTVGVKVDKVVDPDVVRLLDDSDLSRFGSDVEDLEEDFVVRANCVEEGEEEGTSGSRIRTGRAIPPFRSVAFGDDESSRERELEFGKCVESRNCERDGAVELRDNENRRPRRSLDEQFDQLMVHEYGDDSDSDDAGYMESKDVESIAAEMKDALKEYPEDEFEFEEKYKVPADFLRQGQETTSNLLVESSADVMRRCAEYAQQYSQEDAVDEKVVIFEESSDESDVWDCETIISTYSNLDNHPGRIQAPEKPKRKQLIEPVSMFPSEKRKIIALRGKEMLPVDFLPHSRSSAVEKVKKSANSGPEQQKRRPNESKEEKKERKAAVKEVRRQARQAKKELKGLYKCEAQLAQKVAAVSGPSSIHLM